MNCYALNLHIGSGAKLTLAGSHDRYSQGKGFFAMTHNKKTSLQDIKLTHKYTGMPTDAITIPIVCQLFGVTEDDLLKVRMNNNFMTPHMENGIPYWSLSDTKMFICYVFSWGIPVERTLRLVDQYETEWQLAEKTEGGMGSLQSAIVSGAFPEPSTWLKMCDVDYQTNLWLKSVVDEWYYLVSKGIRPKDAVKIVADKNGVMDHEMASTRAE